VWLDFTVTNGRTGHAVAIADFEIPAAAAQSIVIHALPTNPDTGAAGARMACLPLEF
jgi:Cu-Zn family superoxide dismutase